MLLIAGKTSNTRSSTLSMPWPVAPEMEITSNARRPEAAARYPHFTGSSKSPILVPQSAAYTTKPPPYSVNFATCSHAFTGSLPLRVDQMDQNAAAFYMAKEAVANACAFGGSGNQAWILATTNSGPWRRPRPVAGAMS